MKKKSSSQSAFFNLRVLLGLFMVLAGVFLALFATANPAGRSAPPANIAQLQQKYDPSAGPLIDPLVPPGFDCSKVYELGIDKQENFGAGAIMIFCGLAEGGSPTNGSPSSRFIQKLLPSPLTYGDVDKDLINHPETFPNVTQSETFCAVNPDNPQQIVVAFNDSRGRNVVPINISGASVSTDGGTTFDRLTCTVTSGNCVTGQSPFRGTEGDPVVLYKKNNGTWYTVWLDTACGGQGLGGYYSTTPWIPDPPSWTHFCVYSESSADRESGWVDNNTASPHYGRMYISWNDFAQSQQIRLTYSDDGVTWSPPVNVNNTF